MCMYNVVISDHGMLKGRDFQMQNKHLEIHFFSFLSFKKKHWFSFHTLKAHLHLAIFRATCLATLQLHEHHAVGLPAPCKTATEEDQERIIRVLIGWSNKALQVKLYRVGVWLHCNAEKVDKSFCNACVNKKHCKTSCCLGALLQNCDSGCMKNCLVYLFQEQLQVKTAFTAFKYINK